MSAFLGVIRRAHGVNPTLVCFLFLLHDPCLLSQVKNRYLCLVLESTWFWRAYTWDPSRFCLPSLRISLCLWLLSFSWSLSPLSFDMVYNPLGAARWLNLVLFLSIIFPRMSFWGLNSILSLRMVFMIFYLLSFSFGLKIISKASLNNQGNDEYEIGRWSLWGSACLAFDIRVCLMGCWTGGWQYNNRNSVWWSASLRRMWSVWKGKSDIPAHSICCRMATPSS